MRFVAAPAFVISAALFSVAADEPAPEMGGHGTGPGDRGIAFYFEWVRSDIGRWEYSRHIEDSPSSIRD